MTRPQDAAKNLTARLAQFREPDTRRSVWQLASTAALFAGTWALMYFSLRLSYWLTLALAVPAAFLMIRLFIFQHDCGHGSFFKSSRASDIIGSILGVFTLTPYHYWKKTHAIHHATSGNLEHRGFGDIDTLTVSEYLALTRWGRFKYRVYRHPLVLFGVGAVLHFFVKHRLPTIVPRDWTRERRSIFWTDVGLATVIALMGALVGFRALLLVHLPVALGSCTIGVWLFYVQHQFEPTYWEHDAKWQYNDAALVGSSFYRLPRILQWATGNIGLHHIHHLNARIPNYRLQEVFESIPELQQVTTLTLWQSLRCVSLALWDERRQRLIRFREVATAAS
ncbi:MAG TPA: fatty acid desaturase [Gemmatimonadales bacterium]|nr:fatty acid desaturase [Gemmatimonadales bacterium]